MRHSVILSLLGIFAALIGCSPDKSRTTATTAASVTDWQHHCTVAGIAARDNDERAFLERLAADCGPIDACMLSCIRSDCAHIGGGCAHACSNVDINNVAAIAAS